MAIAAMAGSEVVIREKSRFFATPCFPPGSGPDFVNAAVCVETGLSAAALMSFLHEVEKGFGRRRDRRWGPRTLDLDLIAYDNLVLPDEATYQQWAQLPLDQQMQHAPEQLVLPHPRLAERAFVLVPLQEVAPDWVHPVTGQGVAQMVAALSEKQVSEVVAL